MLNVTAIEPRCWEYRAIYLDRPDAVEDLDSLGDAGWELVSVAVAYGYVKRPTDVAPDGRSR